jgi:hypothetical protein
MSTVTHNLCVARKKPIPERGIQLFYNLLHIEEKKRYYCNRNANPKTCRDLVPI